MQLADKMAFVRFLRPQATSGHGRRPHLVMTGYNFTRRPTEAWAATKPAFGAITARSIAASSNAQTGMPTYARLGRYRREPKAPRFLWQGEYALFLEMGGQARSNMDLKLESPNASPIVAASSYRRLDRIEPRSRRLRA